MEPRIIQAARICYTRDRIGASAAHPLHGETNARAFNMHAQLNLHQPRLCFAALCTRKRPPPSRRGGGTTSYDVVKRRGGRRGKRVCGARAEKRKRARGDKRNDNIKRGRVANERGGTGIGQVCSGLVRDYRYTAWKLEGSFDSGEDLTTVELIFLRTRVSRIK